jgi:hypothetical protein
LQKPIAVDRSDDLWIQAQITDKQDAIDDLDKTGNGGRPWRFPQPGQVVNFGNRLVIFL